MNDREALLAAILAHPDEDTPRLVFADYLDENGEGEHAAFIRRQIELADVPEWDERAIRAQPLDHAVSYGRDWPTPDLPAPLKWERPPYRRGFPGAVYVLDGLPFVDQLPGACAVAPLCELHWSGSSTSQPWGVLSHWRTLTDSPWLSRFRSIRLPNTHLSVTDLAALDHSPHVVGLKRLFLASCLFGLDGPAALLSSGFIRRLTHLSFHLPNDATDMLGRLTGHRLQELQFNAGRNNEHSPLWSTGGFRLPLFQGLKELDLSNNLLTPRDLEALASSGALRGLESLQLRGCETGPRSMSSLTECADLALRRLVLGFNKLGAGDAQALAASPQLSGLTVLNLEHNPIGDAGAIALANSPHLANLLQLNIYNCAIGDIGAQAIFDSPLPDRLALFRLDCNDLKPPMKRKFKRRMGERVFT